MGHGWTAAILTWRQGIEKMGHARLLAAIERGELLRALPGVYAVPGALGAWERELAAACAWAGPRSLASFTSAAVLYQLELNRRADIEVTVPRSQNPKSDRVRVHRAHVPERELRRLRGIPCTSLAWTVFDLSSVIEDPEELAILVESAWGRKPYDFRDWLGRLIREYGRGRRSLAALIAALADCRQRSKPMRSPLEVRAWRWLLSLAPRVPRPIPGHDELDAVGRMELDFAWPERRVALETDGYAFHGRERFIHDAQRRSRLAALGWRILIVTERELREHRDRVFDWVVSALAA